MTGRLADSHLKSAVRVLYFLFNLCESCLKVRSNVWVFRGSKQIQGRFFMKILQINNFEDINGGSDRVYQSTSKMLIDRGHEVATLSCGDKSFDSRKTSFLLPRNSYLSASPLRSLMNIRNFFYRPESSTAIYELVSSFRPDIAHLHIFYGQLSSAVIASLRRLKVPCVMTIHEYRMLCPISTLYNQSSGICEKCAAGDKHHAIDLRCNRSSILASSLSAGESWVRDRFYNYMDHIAHFFMVSEFCRDKHAEYLPGIEKKSSILYNFLYENYVVERPALVNYDAPFLYAGRLSHEKGVALLCSAFRDRPNLHLRIAGDGPLKKSLIAEFGRCPNINFLGKLFSDALKKEIQQSKFCIVPSEWYENNPMSVLESFGAGTPVIGANIGGIPELIFPGLTGLLFSPSDKYSLLKALDEANEMSVEIRNSMGREALALINRRHSESVYYEKLIAEYANLISQ
jgi:glycosyltransferase involved in cell wall biosynthesis